MDAGFRLAGVVTNMKAIAGRRDLRRSQDTRVDFWHATVASTFFLVVVGAGLFLGTVMVIGALRSSSSSTELTAANRTGRVTLSLHDGKLCHYIIFDNKTAQALEDRVDRCDETKPQPRRQSPSTFSWGR